MKAMFALLLLGLLPTAASAQSFLSGQYQCLQNCRGPGLAQVTQNGWDLNMVNEAGQPSRGWVDRPGHLWAEYWDTGAVFTPAGLTIQFDNGTVWQRYVPPPPLPPPPVRRHRRHR